MPDSYTHTFTFTTSNPLPTGDHADAIDDDFEDWVRGAKVFDNVDLGDVSDFMSILNSDSSS